MERWPLAALIVACAAGCSSPGAGPVVTAPSSPAWQSTTKGEAEPTSNAAAPEALAACGKPWRLEVMGGDGRVVVVCAHDVRRAALDESTAFDRALGPALDPARDRVCACAGRVRPPAFVDLVFTAHPDEGHVTVQAGADDDLDPDLGPAFVACVGTVAAAFAPFRADVCAETGKSSFVYPVRVELE